LEGGHFELVFDVYFIFSWFKSCIYSSPKFTEVWETSSSHPDNEMLIFHVVPLDVLVTLAIWWVLNIFKFVLDIRGPGNVCVIDGNLTSSLLLQLESVIEKTLGNESAWNSWIGWLEFLTIQVLSLVPPEVAGRDNWIAVSEFVNWHILSI